MRKIKFTGESCKSIAYTFSITDFDDTMNIFKVAERMNAAILDDSVQVDAIHSPVISEAVEQEASQDDSFSERKRLPNTIDPKDLDIHMMQTEGVLLRCPHCFQGDFFILKIAQLDFERNHIIIRNDKTNEYVVFSNDCNKREIKRFSNSVKDFYARDTTALGEMSLLDYVMIQNNLGVVKVLDLDLSKMDKVVCPLCDGDAFSGEDAEHAFSSIRDNVEFQHTCMRCGGEVVETVNKDSHGIDDKDAVYTCEQCHITGNATKVIGRKI